MNTRVDPLNSMPPSAGAVDPEDIPAEPTTPISLALARWQGLAPRERQLVLVAALVVMAALVWWLLLAPAMRTLREAPAQHAQLDVQLESMQALAQEAQQLQADAANRPSPAQAQRALVAATTALGPAARATFVGDRATVTLEGVPASAIAPWLAQMRSNARSVPVEAHLTRSTAVARAVPASRPQSGSPGNLAVSPMGRAVPAAVSSQMPAAGTASNLLPAANPTEARWDGRVVLALPAR